MPSTGIASRLVVLCLLAGALVAGPVAATQADTPTATTAGTDDGGGPAVLVLVALLPIVLLVGVVAGVVELADRDISDGTGD